MILDAILQAHLLSVFDNTKHVTFHEKDYERIVAIISKEEEVIELEKPVMAQGRNIFPYICLRGQSFLSK